MLRTLGPFDWSWPAKIKRLQVQNLFHLGFVAQHASLVFILGTGLRNRHLMKALGHAACLRAHPVLFTGAIDIVNALACAQAGASIKRTLENLFRLLELAAGSGHSLHCLAPSTSRRPIDTA